jgi:hypothetical protein
MNRLDDTTPTYIGRLACGCVAFAVIDDPTRRDEVATEVATAIRAGLTIELRDAQFVRNHWGPGCDQCRKSKSKAVQSALQL